MHSLSDVSCTDCHNVHKGPDLIVSLRETAQMCFKCHQQIQAEFSLPEHHPVPEGKVFCTDCHDPHGTLNEKMLRKDTIKQTCTQCHAEKEGPYAFEHADLMEDCTNCHSPHGSPNRNLLVVRVPFLCLQCHSGHNPSTGQRAGAFYTRCTDCHSQIHGTDTVGSGGQGLFTR
jgi:DmsE family decaheme c-type cytochrome